MNCFNPKLQEFLKEKKDITMLGFAWSMYWRWAIILFGIGFVVGILAEL